MNLALLPASTDERRVVDVIAARCASRVVRSRPCVHEHEWLCVLCDQPDDECRCGRAS